MSLEKVDKLVDAFVDEESPARRVKLKSIYEKEKNEFKHYASYISRHCERFAVNNLKESYHNNDFSDLKIGAEKDMQFGKIRRELAKNIVTTLLRNESTQSIPESSDFLDLPASTKGTRRAATILEKVSNWNFNNLKQKDFASIRHHDRYTTLIAGNRYLFALPLIDAVSEFSKSVERKDDKTLLLTYNVGGNKLVLNEIIRSPSLNEWKHGRSPINTTWQKIEDIFEEIWEMELKKPNENAADEEKKIHQQKLTQFYALAAELVWLIGNTQPMLRGTGTYAEMMLNIVCMRHGVEPPVLKPEFPQLDVLDISFPLNDYKFLFPYFFEPITIPEHLRFPNIPSSSPIDEQMKELYSRLNEKSKSLESKTMSLEEKSSIPIANINKKDINTETLLLKAAFDNHLTLAKVLLENKADPNIARSDGIFPLFQAAANNNIELSKLLIEHNADVNMTYNDQTTLYTSVCFDKIEAAELLLQAGAARHHSQGHLFHDIFRQDVFPIEHSFSGQMELLEKALINGTLLLLLAAKNGNHKMCDILVQHGADVNDAMLIAQKYCSLGIVIQLRQYQAEMSAVQTSQTTKEADTEMKVQSDSKSIDEKNAQQSVSFFNPFKKETEVRTNDDKSVKDRKRKRSSSDF